MSGIEQTGAARPRRRTALRTTVKVTLLVLVVIIASFLIVRGSLQVYYKGKLAKEIERLKALGGSQWAFELAPPAMTKAEGNSAYLLQASGLLYEEPKDAPRADGGGPGVAFNDPKAGDALKIRRAYEELGEWRGLEPHLTLMPAYSTRHKPRSRPWNPAWLPWLEKHLADNAIALSMIEQAADAGRGIFEVKWSDGLATMLPHLAKLRSQARLLRVEAAVRAAKGDMKGAFDDVRRILRLRRFIKDEPATVSKLVGMAMDTVAFETLQGCLDFGPIDRDSAAALLAELDGREEINNMARGFMFDAAAGLKAIRDAAANPSQFGTYSSTSSSSSRIDPMTLWWLERSGLTHLFNLYWIAPADECDFLKRMNAATEAAKLPFPPALDAPPAPPAGNPWTFPFSYTAFTNLFTPDLSRLIWQSALRDADVSLARTVLALSLYKAENGRYPDTLSALVPTYLQGVEADPFSGKPLLYKTKGDGFVLYSVAENRADDGGAWAGGTGAGDETWERDK